MEAGRLQSNRIGYLLNQVELSNLLRRYWSDNIHWTRGLYISTLFDLENKPYIERRMLRNATDISNVFRFLYGDAVAERIERILSEYTTTFFEMSDALAHQDMDTANKLYQRLFEQLDELVQVLGNTNRYIDKEELRVMLYDLLYLSQEEASQIYSRQYQESIDQYDEIYDQATRIADYLARAIIEQIRV